MPRRLAQRWMTLSDLEWPFHASRAISAIADLFVRLSWKKLEKVAIISRSTRCHAYLKFLGPATPGTRFRWLHLHSLYGATLLDSHQLRLPSSVWQSLIWPRFFCVRRLTMKHEKRRTYEVWI